MNDQPPEDRQTSRQIQAARNNAIWCDAVCRAHGCACEFMADAWLNRGTPPPYYSNMVTMRGGESVNAQTHLIRDILQANPHQPFGFKDSFCCIDPTELGVGRRFQKLFDATWIWLEPAKFQPRETPLRWARINSARELIDWENAWRGDAANIAAATNFRQFPAYLLDDPSIAFLSGRARDGSILAVAVANQTDDVVGLSNVFGPSCIATDLWAGATAAALNAFSTSLPLVGYERGDSLEDAIAQGFDLVAPLRVWVADSMR